MKRIFKIAFFGLLAILLLLIATPFLFKDDIKTMIRDDANDMLNAHLYFGDVGLSFLKNFPNACISIQDFGLVGKGIFELDTLAQGKRFDLVVDLMSVISGSDLKIKKILLDQPKVHVIVLEDGQANYDIMKPDSTTVVEDTSTSNASFNIGLQEYRLTDANIRYEDATLPMDLILSGMNHSGSGDFTADVYELRTQTNIQALTAIYDGIAYLNKTSLDADAQLKVDMSRDMRIDFMDNEFTLNALTLGLDGYVAMPGDDIDMDLTYEAKQTTFKSLLSLVPGVYTEDFQEIETDGSLRFDGHVKGIYNDDRLPGFGLNAQVANAMMHYPDLPESITGIDMDLAVNNPDGELEHTHILLKEFHADLGSNPIDAQADISGMERVQLKGKLDANLNLGELTRMFPVEGIDLKGIFSLKASANGIYDEKTGSFPTVEGVMDMKDGYLKNADYPAELTELHFHGELQDVDGQLTSAVLEVPDFHLLLDGEPLDGSMRVQNFDNPTYALQAKGRLDLEKLMQIYPIDSMTLKGKLIVENFSTAGTYSDIEAERYTELPTSGNIQIQNLLYSDYELAAPITIDQGSAVFTPARIDIRGARGKLGKSDYQVDGYVDNYLAYALMENELLQGNMQLVSNTLDINEWMEEESPSTESSAPPSTSEESPYEAIPVPANLDVGFQARINKVMYEDLVLENMQGGLRVADETVQMEDLGFKMLGSNVLMSGEYKTQNPRQPSYHFFMDLKQLAVKKVVEHFPFVKEFAPALEFIDGICNTQFGIGGLLRSDMMPVLESINSEGLFNMLNGGLKQTPMLSSLSEKTKIESLGTLNLADASGKFEIRDGFLIVSPIDLKAGDVVMTIGGQQSLAGNLDYLVSLDAPSGKLDQAAIGALSNLTGAGLTTGDRLKINLTVGGTHSSPKISGGSGGTGDQLKDQLTETAEQKLEQQLGTDVELNKDSLTSQLTETKEEVKDSIKELVEDTKAQAKDTLQALVDDKKEEVKDEISKEVGDVLGDEAKSQLEELKNKFGLPKRKKKKKK
ncbi:MAG: AsmA-like C-terminal region-containing protein [Bacteroidota bacterium]